MAKLVTLVLVITLPAVVLAQAPATSPATQPDVEQIVETVREADNWIHQVKSFYVKFEVRWERSPQALAKRADLFAQRLPNEVLDPVMLTDLWPTMTQTLELAFDDHRIAKRSITYGVSSSQTIWDGKRLISHEDSLNPNQESQSVLKSPNSLVEIPFFANTSWLRTTSHHFWWEKLITQPVRIGLPNSTRSNPRDNAAFEMIDRQTYRGHDCYVLEDWNNRRWYVEANTQRIQGLMNFPMNRYIDYDTVAIETAGHFGHVIANSKAMTDLISALPDQQSKALKEAYIRELKRREVPSSEFYLLDYRQLQPGQSFPMVQGDILYERDAQGGMYPSVWVCETAVDVRVDQPIPEDIFRYDMKEGVMTYDETYDPPIRYKYTANPSPEEWKHILAEAKAEQQEREEARKLQAQRQSARGAVTRPDGR